MMPLISSCDTSLAEAVRLPGNLAGSAVRTMSNGSIQRTFGGLLGSGSNLTDEKPRPEGLEVKATDEDGVTPSE